MMRFIKSCIMLLVACAVAGAAFAAPPASSAYGTDPQNINVQDQTSQGINQLNMVLCIMNAMAPSDMLTQRGTLITDGSTSVTYLALVDKNKCDPQSQGSTSNAGSSATSTQSPRYVNAVVKVTRANNSSPMLAKIWMNLTNDSGNPVTVYVNAQITQAPSSTLPYGLFRLDYIGKSNGVTGFNGFISSASSGLSFYEDSSNEGGGITALGLAASTTSSGAGTMSNGGSAFNFAYNTANFRRSDGTNDICFSRSLTNAQKAVWSYGTYDNTTGNRVDVQNPGFPVLATDSSSNKYYGFASYWGINFQGVNLNSVADGQLTGGYTISDQRPNNSTTYNLFKVSGKLTKWSQNTTTLAAIDGVPFSAFANLTGATTGNALATGQNNWQFQWNAASNSFQVTGIQFCGNNGCTVQTLSPVATVRSSSLVNQTLVGQSDSLGGQVFIPQTGAAHTGIDAVYYYTQSTVLPGSAGAPSNLSCVTNCPTATSMQSFTGSNSPYGSGTGTQWGGGASRVQYTFGSTGLVNGSTVLTDTNSSHFTGQWANGVMTGSLFDSTQYNMTTSCQTGQSFCEPKNPTVYYTWQTGSQNWSQTLWLTKSSDSSVVQFDPPQIIPYQVTSTDDTSGRYVGKNLQLQFNGFGNLFGIPGYCVSQVDNSLVSCDNGIARYVPSFSLADGDTMRLGAQTIITKALNAELHLSKVASSNCSALTLAAQTVPTGSGLHDPSSSSDSFYLGTQPTVSSTPSVVQGILQ